ncbi:methyltransferase domain-containing protein [Sarocladium implicatum]|nr:methyltransferase domain-containing protein [Sarocladium implicatum]
MSEPQKAKTDAADTKAATALPGTLESDPAPLAVDDNADDEGDEESLRSERFSETTSIASTILAYRKENGRTYHAYKDGTYVLPNDESENERLDLQHNLLLMTFDSKLHCAPLPKAPERVLDAGCGTGIWAIEFADEHPKCHVTGIDLSPIQPSFVPPNVSFYVDDLEDEWTFETKFDFIFSRFMTGSIRDWPRYMKQCYDNLEPGGTVEFMDILYPLLSSDGTLTPTTPLNRWANLLEQGFAANGHSMRTALSYQDWLPAAGFVDVQVVKEKWPSNTWPRDPKYKKIGLWTCENAIAALQALSLAIFTRPEEQGGLGWKMEELEALLEEVKRDFKDKSIHAYWPIWSVYARKPE